MRCLECKIVKFDNKQHKWVCPAHPYAEIDLYTVHRNCGANRWYPNYVRDAQQCVLKALVSQRVYEGILNRSLNEARTVDLRQDLTAELEALANRAKLHYAELSKQADALHNEIERLKKNGLV